MTWGRFRLQVTRFELQDQKKGGFKMINVRKKDKETSESLIRRFSRRVQQSRILMQARKARFQEEEKSKAEKRKEALYKIKIKKEIDKLKKMGKFDDEALKNIKKKMD